jgi:hypothetical protein
MDYKEDMDKAGGAAAKIHKIRITLTSREVKPLEKCKSRSKIWQWMYMRDYGESWGTPWGIGAG